LQLSLGQKVDAKPTDASSDETVLKGTDVHVYFEGVKAVNGVDFLLSRGETLGLIGPNGAGKTTLVNVLSGFQRPKAGTVLLNGTDVTAWLPDQIARAGVVRTFQGVRSFESLTVFENVHVAALAGRLRSRGARELTANLLRSFHLDGVGLSRAGSLAHGQERRLGIARALAAEPTFLLLDEPGAGLNETESAELVDALGRIRHDFSLGLLVIEHDMQIIMSLCDRIQVLDHGKTIAVGTPKEIQSNPAVIDAYLGSESAVTA
jgi:branched-chain amino acid transport system ATP-binding protein